MRSKDKSQSLTKMSFKDYSETFFCVNEIVIITSLNITRKKGV